MAHMSFLGSTVLTFSQMDKMSNVFLWENEEETGAWSDGYRDWHGERAQWSPDG